MDGMGKLLVRCSFTIAISQQKGYLGSCESRETPSGEGKEKGILTSEVRPEG